MSLFENLVSLDLRQLAATLGSQAPSVTDLEPSQWLGLVELLTGRMVDECEGLPAEVWATFSTALDHTLHSAEASGAITHHESVIRRLNLSRALLDRISPIAGVDILDPVKAVDLLLVELPMPIHEARDLSDRWRSLEVSQIRELRLSKNLLAPVLAMKRSLPDDVFIARLSTWEEIFPSLP